MEYEPNAAMNLWKDGKLWDDILRENRCIHNADVHPAVPWNTKRCKECDCPRCFDYTSSHAPYWWP